MKKLIILITLVFFTSCSKEIVYKTTPLPTLNVNGSTDHRIAKAYRLAIGDITSNIQKHKSGALTKPEPCILAGLVYNKPWTRDASINAWNGGGLLFPDAAKNTLLAQVGEDEEGNKIIIGQYWDNIIWGIGAWHYYLYNHDKEFLKYAYEIIQNTLANRETEELDEALNLFRGPAVYGDGVSAYPKIYTESETERNSGTWSGIYVWPDENPTKKAKVGYGMPMMALSTNCVYAEIYEILSLIEKELNQQSNNNWTEKYSQMSDAINKNFWNTDNQRYDYLLDPFGGCDYQEGMGHAFAVLFGIANEEKVKQINENIHVEPAGMPCVYPAFPRHKKTPDSYGRHAGTVWPHVQGFWADACMKSGNIEGFLHEFNNLIDHAYRDFQFVEIYHPTTGLPYGGLQEPDLAEETVWFCGERQTWSATAYLRMIILDIIGMEFTPDGIKFNPFLPKGIETVEFGNVHYLDASLNIKISGKGNRVQDFRINDKQSSPFLPITTKGNIEIEITIE